MDKKKYILFIGLILLVGFFSLKELNKGEKSLGYTQFTQQTSNGKYTDSADMYQNVQALVERFASSTAGYIFQSDSNGVMQPVNPNSLTGDFAFTTLVRKGDAATFTTTSAATSANVCDNPLWTITATGATPTVTLPATTTLFADCLDSTVKSVNFVVLNGSSVTSTVLAAGGGGTLNYSSSSTIAAGKTANVTVVRNSDTTYRVLLTNQPN